MENSFCFRQRTRLAKTPRLRGSSELEHESVVTRSLVCVCCEVAKASLSGSTHNEPLPGVMRRPIPYKPDLPFFRSDNRPVILFFPPNPAVDIAASSWCWQWRGTGALCRVMAGRRKRPSTRCPPIGWPRDVPIANTCGPRGSAIIATRRSVCT